MMMSTGSETGPRLQLSLTGLLIIIAAFSVAFAAADDGASEDNDVFHGDGQLREAFGCEVCRVFCIEYEEKFKAKKGDDPFEVAVEGAREATMRYRWDEGHRTLRPGGQDIGVPVPAEIHRQLDDHVVAPYNQRVILHALHAAAHVQRPPKLNWHFCRRVLCDHHLGHCEPDPDQRPYGEMTKAYKHFVEHFDGRDHNPRIEHNRRGFNGAHDAHRSHVHRRFAEDGARDAIDPARMSPEVLARMREAERDAEFAANRAGWPDAPAAQHDDL